MAFTRWAIQSFVREDLIQWLLRTARSNGQVNQSEKSIKRDVEVFIRTYVVREQGATQPVEESLECPLSELGLIQEIDSGVYGLQRRERTSLPITVFAYALADYWQREAAMQETLSVDRILYSPGSPGAAFQLSDTAAVSLLEKLPENSGMRYDESAGQRLLVKEAKKDALDILRGYYQERS